MLRKIKNEIFIIFVLGIIAYVYVFSLSLFAGINVSGNVNFTLGVFLGIIFAWVDKLIRGCDKDK